jgi:hypothetical protein
MRFSHILRWIARVWGIVSFLLIAAFMFGGAEHLRPTANEAIGMALFPIGVLIGFAVAWWREGLGGLISVCSLALFYGWSYFRSERFPTGPYFLLFSAPGFIHLFNAAMSRRKTS